MFTTACDSAVCHAYNGALYDKSSSFVPVNTSEIPFPPNFADFADFPTGQVGRDTVAIGGLTMQNQTVGAVDNATSSAIWNGTAGVLGLAPPSQGRCGPCDVQTATTHADRLFFELSYVQVDAMIELVRSQTWERSNVTRAAFLISDFTCVTS